LSTENVAMGPYPPRVNPDLAEGVEWRHSFVVNRTTTSLALLLLTVALSACRKDDETVASTSEPPPATVPTPTATAPVTATIDPLPTTVAPPPGTAPGTTPKLDAGVLDAGVRDAATADAASGATDAGRVDAGSPSQRAQACFDKCAASMQSCIIPSTGDGGFPKFKDPAECRAAAEACRTACQ
jgi:hypothetical protein